MRPVGKLHFGPARVLSRESPEEAIELLRERGYTANEIDFESGFWMDYPWAEEFGKLARKRRIALSVHAPIAGFMGHVERDRKHGMATGMLDHSAGIAKVAGAAPVVFHPGFLLGRTRKQTISSVVSQLADFRKRIEAKDRGVAFGVEIMGRVNDFGSLEDVLAISSRLALGAPGDRLRAHARDERRRVHDGEGVPRRARRREPRPPARRAVPHPLLGHRLREPERDEAPALRRGHAAGGAARQGAGSLPPTRDRDQRGARARSHIRRFGRSSSRPPARARRGAPRAAPPRRRVRGRAGTERTGRAPRARSTRKSVSATAASSLVEERLGLIVATLRGTHLGQRPGRRRA